MSQLVDLLRLHHHERHPSGIDTFELRMGSRLVSIGTAGLMREQIGSLAASGVAHPDDHVQHVIGDVSIKAKGRSFLATAQRLSERLEQLAPTPKFINSNMRVEA